MKKLILTIATMFILVSTSAFAGSCEVPNFLKEGMDISFIAGTFAKNAKVLVIDRKACWIKVYGLNHLGRDTVSWVNLNTVNVIEPQRE